MRWAAGVLVKSDYGLTDVQARCYDVGAAIDFASLPDFMIHI